MAATRLKFSSLIHRCNICAEQELDQQNQVLRFEVKEHAEVFPFWFNPIDLVLRLGNWLARERNFSSAMT